MPADRRARRRQETIEEILDLAEAVMTEEGVNGLSLAEVARRLGVQPPSLYKYFPSLMSVYDALFLSHLGDYRCPACGNRRPPLDVVAREIQIEGTERLSMVIRDERDGHEAHEVQATLGFADQHAIGHGQFDAHRGHGAGMIGKRIAAGRSCEQACKYRGAGRHDCLG